MGTPNDQKKGRFSRCREEQKHKRAPQRPPPPPFVRQPRPHMKV